MKYFMTLSITNAIRLASLSVLIALSTTVYAGPGHDHHHQEQASDHKQQHSGGHGGGHGHGDKDHGHGDKDHGHGHGHGHGHNRAAANAKSILSAATEAVAQLFHHKQVIEGKALDQAWLNMPEGNKSVAKRGNGYFIVRYQGPADRPLFLLLSDEGDLYDANYTGHFPGLEE